MSDPLNPTNKETTSFRHLRSSGDWKKEEPFKHVLTERITIDPPVWDDLRVPVTATTSAGSSPPVFSLFRNNLPPGEGPIDAYALEFNNGATNQHITVPHDSTLDFSNDYSIEFWILPDPGYTAFNSFMAKLGTFNIQIISGGRIRFNVTGYAQVDSTAGLNIGSWNHVVCRVDNSAAGNDVLNVFIDADQEGQVGPTWGTPGTSTDPLIIGAGAGGTGGQHVTLDEVRFWSKALSNSEIVDSFNSNQGTYVPTDTTGLIAAYHFEEGSGTLAEDYSGNGNDGTLVNDPQWVSGYVDPVGGGETTTRGVFTYLFSPDKNEEVFFTVQLPHSWKEGTAIEPHIHWAPTESGNGYVRWGLEYTLATVGGNFGTTSIIYGETDILDPFTHQITGLDPNIDMTGNVISSMLVCRLFRDSENDTYDSRVALLELDFHFQVDGLGSDQRFVKDDLPS